MRHSEEERDPGSLGGECSESTQLLDGEQSQPRAGMAWAGRAWRTGQEPLAHLHVERDWPWSPVSKWTQQSLQGSEERSSNREQLLQGGGDTGTASWTAQLAKTGTLCCDTRKAKVSNSGYQPSIKGSSGYVSSKLHYGGFTFR